MTMMKMKRRLLLRVLLYFSLVTTLVSSLSTPNRGGKFTPSAQIASPESTIRRRATSGGPQKDITFVSSSRSSRGNSSRQQNRPPIPLVDSTLLRFLNSQKETQRTENDTQTPVAQTNDSTVAVQQQQQQQQQEEENDTRQQSQQQTQTISSSSSSSPSWLGQYNRHLVASSLLELQGVHEEIALQAGDAVERHVLARTTKQRVRLFLRKRDKLWDTTSGTTQSNNTNNTTPSISYSQEQQDAMSSTIVGNCDDISNVINLLLEKGLTGTDVCSILCHTPSVALMRPTSSLLKEGDEDTSLECTVTRAFTNLLSTSLKLRKYDARKVLRNCPGLLTVRGSKNAQHVVTLLSKCGVSKTSLARDKTALPILLSRSPAQLFRLVSFLSSDAVRMNVNAIGPLLRRADCAPLLNKVAPVPRIHQEDELTSLTWGRTSQERRQEINVVYAKMSDTAWTLRHEIGTRDLGKVIAAYPSVLLLDAKTQILPVASYLMNDLDIWQDDLGRVLQLYPVLLGMDVRDMKRVVNYLLSLEVAEENLASIFRAFPSLFTLDIVEDMQPVVEFLREIGINNVGRFITRLPPVLGYSVEDELVPKWEYLCTVCTQGTFELSAFPAYFSYPLDKRIKTRYQYLQKVKRIPTQLLALDKVLRYGDRDFATRVARDTDDGAAFLEFCKGKQNEGDGARRKRAPAKKKAKTRGAHRRSTDKRI